MSRRAVSCWHGRIKATDANLKMLEWFKIVLATLLVVSFAPSAMLVVNELLLLFGVHS